MCRKLCDKLTVHAEIRKGYGYISLSAAECCLQSVVLEKPVISLRCQTQHYFSESNDSSHDLLLLSSKDSPKRSR